MYRIYSNDEITVFWFSTRCRHAKRCVTGCPKVFDIQRKPWIDISQDENANIWKAISECPTHALTITYNHGIRVVLEEEQHRSAAYDGDSMVGICEYIVTGDEWTIVHTRVLSEYGGKNIAKRLVFCVAENAERAKKKIAVVVKNNEAVFDRIIGALQR